MGRPRKNSNNNALLVDNFSNYYFFLFKNRLNWTGHSIPVIGYDSTNRFYIEGYIETVKNIKTEEELNNTTVIFFPAFFPTNSDSPLYLLAKDIYPSNRKLLKFKGSELVELNINSQEVKSKFVIPFSIEENKELQIVRFMLTYNTPFTISEISSQLNIDLNTVENIIKKIGKKESIRNDLISGLMQPTFSVDNSKIFPLRKNIEDLYSDYKDCIRCNLGIDRQLSNKNSVFGRGNIFSDLFIVGEAPGIQEEKSGIAFNSNAPAGELLYKVMSAAGIDQDKCWITNTVLCRPLPSENSKSQNGKPNVTCINTCSKRLHNEIAIGKPRIIVLLGSIAYSGYFGTDAPSVLKNSGWVLYSKDIKVYYMAHPSYIVRQLSMEDNFSKQNDIKKDYLNHWTTIRNNI